jgi:hypothetical protein
MGLADINIDVGSALSGLGTLAKDLRAAITGDISAEKKAEIALKVQEMEMEIAKVQNAVILAESSSQDKWTSRGRPMFLYVMYVMLLSAIPMGVVWAISPQTATDVTLGFQRWLQAIPGDLYALFGAGYLGYGAFRTYDKRLNAGK